MEHGFVSPSLQQPVPVCRWHCHCGNLNSTAPRNTVNNAADSKVRTNQGSFPEQRALLALALARARSRWLSWPRASDSEPAGPGLTAAVGPSVVYTVGAPGASGYS
jgi:hypothetical protein